MEAAVELSVLGVDSGAVVRAQFLILFVGSKRAVI